MCWFAWQRHITSYARCRTASTALPHCVHPRCAVHSRNTLSIITLCTRTICQTRTAALLLPRRLHALSLGNEQAERHVPAENCEASY